MIYSRIEGTGHHLPEKVMTNFDLEKLVDTSDEWIKTRTGVERRHIASNNEAASDLGLKAAKKAMIDAKVSKEEIDLIVVGTTTPDYIFPNVATLIQEGLDIHGCPAFSVEAACSGFVYALSVADKFIKSGGIKSALVIGAEVMTKLIDWEDRKTCVLFGDGAGAVVLKPSNEQGIIDCQLGADGQYKDLLWYPAGPSKDFKNIGTGNVNLEMNGSEVFKVAVRTLGSVAEETLDANDIDKGELDWLIPHQANLRIIQATAKRLDLPMDKVILTVQDHGNTSSASIPMALDVGIKDGRIKRNQLILMEAFGGGFTWGTVLMRY
ncbi:MAG: beta-ketoacyl-ACP synthase III [Pseudomonadota bacterium]|nr:beta-ketoacyl-ACP synthase III [Pseudomonadota bacterium]